MSLLEQPSTQEHSKGFYPDIVDSSVTQWVESIPRPEHDPAIHSPIDDSRVNEPQDHSVHTVEWNAATEIGYFEQPFSMTCTSIGSLVRDPDYRTANLASNKIFLRDPMANIPDHVARLVDLVRKKRDSPGPSLEQIGQDEGLYDLLTDRGKGHVEQYFHSKIFSHPELDNSLRRSIKIPMSRHAMPICQSWYEISHPRPDILYGYERAAFSKQQQTQLIHMGKEVHANRDSVVYPFLAVEFTANDPSKGCNLWAATNRCLGCSTSCVNLAEHLRDRLQVCKNRETHPIDTSAFSIAMSGTEARLFVAWKQDESEHHMKWIESFLLQDPGHYLKFRACVLNIIDWGVGQRLSVFRAAVDDLIEERAGDETL